MDVTIRPLAERDLPEADRIVRLAFGTFLGLPDPMAFMGDADYVNTRWRAAPDAAFGAYAGDELVGSNFVSDWGGFGFFGPLSIRPDLWNRGIGQKLMAPVMAHFERRGTRQAGLFTFADSPKHHALYGKFGFAVQALTPVMSKPVAPGTDVGGWSTWAGLSPDERQAGLDACRALAGAVNPGLDLEGEMRAIDRQGLGETLLLREDAELAGFAVCHIGPGSEAGGGALYVKFGAARPGPGAARRFERLLGACEALAQERGAQRLVGGVNAARAEALAIMRGRGFETELEGVAMQRPDTPGHNRADCFVIDDWR